jgi:hypothetical protein
MELECRQLDYFNSESYYYVRGNLGDFVTKCHLHNGYWYADYGCKVKMTTVLCCVLSAGFEVEYENTGIKGTVSKWLNQDLGVVWHQGQGEKFKEHGFPHYWNYCRNLRF